jgi:hypothetical protein
MQGRVTMVASLVEAQTDPQTDLPMNLELDLVECRI